MATAILTKYLGPTDHRGARIKAWSVTGKSVTVPYQHELEGEAVYRVALLRWLEKHRPLTSDILQRAEWVAGETVEGYAFVPVLK